jgi:hypothetical protein
MTVIRNISAGHYVIVAKLIGQAQIEATIEMIFTEKWSDAPQKGRLEFSLPFCGS